MTDTLRTRIASVLADATADIANANGGAIPDPLDCGLLADAVIRELGLQRLEAGKWADGLSSHRYITDWIANE